MKDKNNIEIIYISSNNKIISNNVELKDDFTLQNLIDYMITKSIFSKDFLLKKRYGCYGEIIDFDYVIKKNDRIEILDNLKMNPNEKRKHKFQKHQ